MAKFTEQEMMDLFAQNEREVQAAFQRSRELCAALVAQYGPYRGSLPGRRIAGLGALKNGRFIVEVNNEFFEEVWSNVAGFCSPSRIVITGITHFLAKKLTLVEEAMRINPVYGMQYIEFLQNNTRLIISEMNSDRNRAVSTGIVKNGEDIPMIVMPKSKRFDIEDHEIFHFTCLSIIMLSTQATDRSPKSIRDGFNDFFLDELVEVHDKSHKKSWHFTYRELISPYYSDFLALGYEEIFARTATASKNGVREVIDEDIRILQAHGIVAPANYPDIVRFCLTEIHDHVVQKYGSHEKMIEAAAQHLGVLDYIKSFY